MRALGILILGLLLLAAAVTAAYLMTAPAGPARLSASFDRLRPGPHGVGRAERTLVDGSRPTARNGDFAGAPSRTLETTIWFPESVDGAHPLVVYSHGFLSMRSEGERYAEDLASHGVVVVAADFPLTSFRAPGGPSFADVANQPGDVSFLIDTLIGWSEAERPFLGTIDPQRIGAAGLSLGGLTTTLATFHPTLRDPRIAAAVSIAGPSAMFGPRFFSHARAPFLMIGGEADAIVDYAANAAPIPRKLVHGGALLSLAGGTHAGFAAISAGLMHVLGNPDRLGCWALSRMAGPVPETNPFEGLGGEEQGVLAQVDMPPPCASGVPSEALAPGRQLMITTLALRAFFESAWASDPAEREAAARYLGESLPKDFAEVRYQAIDALPPSRDLVLPQAPYHPGVPSSDPVDAPQGPLAEPGDPLPAASSAAFEIDP